MLIVVLGSGAGGGVPQWNCACRVCSLARAGNGRVLPRTQSGLAISGDGVDFFLINASPDLRAQILDCPWLRPRGAGRGSPIRGVVLTNLDVDAIAGLLTLREGHRFTIYATHSMLAMLDANPIFNVLSRDVVERRAVGLDEPFEPIAGVVCALFPTPRKVALWRESDEIGADGERDATVGVELRASGRRALYAPACSMVDAELLARAEGADALLFDGATYTDDELIAQSLNHKTASRMGHVAMSGAQGSLRAFAGTSIATRIYVHINNSNPALISGSEERAAVEAAGWTIGYDGQELRL